MTTPQEYYNESRKMTMQEALEFAKEYHEAMLRGCELYTEGEVCRLLEVQRENCYAAVYNATLNDNAASYAIGAPEPIGGHWRKK